MSGCCPECGSSSVSRLGEYGTVILGRGTDRERELEVVEYRCNEPDCGVGFLRDSEGGRQ